jgi:hypothetical protein
MISSSATFRRYVFTLLYLGFPLFVHPCQAEVHGFVTDATTHQPIGGVDILVMNFGFSPAIPMGGATTAANGSYSVPLPDGNGGTLVTSQLGYDEYFHNLPGQPATLRLDIALTRVAAIQGKVFGPDSTPVEAQVFIIDAVAGGYGLSVSSDGSGNFEMNHVAPGKYLLCVVNPLDEYRDACYDNKQIGADGIPNGTPVDIQGQLVSNLDIHLQNGASISGALTDRLTDLPLHDSSVSVALFTSQGSLASYFWEVPHEDGSYRIPGLAPGSYFLAIGDEFTSDAGHLPQLYGGNDCVPSSTSGPPVCSFGGVAPLVVTQNGLTNVNFALSPKDYVFRNGFD